MASNTLNRETFEWILDSMPTQYVWMKHVDTGVVSSVRFDGESFNFTTGGTLTVEFDRVEYTQDGNFARMYRKDVLIGGISLDKLKVME